MFSFLILDHQFYHKWAIISSEDFAGGPKGYLKVDISILTAGETPKIPLIKPEDTDIIEGCDVHYTHFFFLIFLFCSKEEVMFLCCFFLFFLVIYFYRKV